MIFCWAVSAHAQEAISASGGNATATGGSVSYTIGQIAGSTITGTNGSVIQGVQQPYEISVVTSIENTSSIDLQLIIYPNPTRGVVKLLIESFDNQEMRFQLYDINSVLLQDKKINSPETEISMEMLPSSIYLLKVFINSKVVKIFKIIKN